MAIFLDLPKVPLPGPPALPVVGTKLNVFRFLADPVARMLDLHEQHGNFVALARDDPGWLCAFGSELNHRVLGDPALFPNFIEMMVSVPRESAAATLEMNILARNGDDHRRQRRIIMAGFSKERLAGYAEQIVEIAIRRIDGWSCPGPVATREQMTLLSLEIAMRCLFGLRLEDAQELSRDAVHTMDLVLNPATALLPFDLPGTPYRDLLRTAERIDVGLRELIARRRREGLGSDVLSAIIGATDEDGNSLGDRELVGQSTTLVNASHETTGMTLTWACLMLATHPEIQGAVAAEVAEVLGDRPPTLDDLEQMPLLGRVIDETLRLFPATPNLFFRRASADFELAGHRLPAGATILLSPLITHRDPTRFPAPRRFDPRRWDGLKLGPYDYIPFGAGVRRCIGAGFAGQATRLILAILLQRVRLCVPRPLHIDYRAKGVVLGLCDDISLELASVSQDVCAPAPVTGTIERLVEFGG
jgi:cytochrome P450